MIAAKQLIELNNEKRKELAPENEKYYTDFLIYIRLHFLLSEQQTEEILMEILDHLIDGQRDGKSAQVIFGNDPKGYADEIIQQIPKEERKNILKFIFSTIALNLLGWFFLTRGIIILIISFLKDVDTEINLFKSVVIAGVIILSCLSYIGLIFKLIRNTLFTEKKRDILNALKGGSLGVICLGIVIAICYFVPNLGPSFPFTWYASLIIGTVFLVISKFIK